MTIVVRRAAAYGAEGLLETAGLGKSKLAPIHGSFLTTTCSNLDCTFKEKTGWVQPLVPELTLPTADNSDPTVKLPPLFMEALSRCPQGENGLQRPGVVWYGEQLPQHLLRRTDKWIESLPRVDILLVVGTSARVFPAAEYCG